MYVGSNKSIMLSYFFSSSALVNVPPVVSCVEGDSIMNSLKNVRVAYQWCCATTSLRDSCSVLPLQIDQFREQVPKWRGVYVARQHSQSMCFPVFVSPWTRRRGNVALTVGQEAGMEEPREWRAKCEILETEVAPASQGSNGLFSGDVGIVAFADAVDRI